MQPPYYCRKICKLIYFQIDKTYIYSYKEFEMIILTLSSLLEKAFANQGQKIREIVLLSVEIC